MMVIFSMIGGGGGDEYKSIEGSATLATKTTRITVDCGFTPTCVVAIASPDSSIPAMGGTNNTLSVWGSPMFTNFTSSGISTGGNNLNTSMDTTVNGKVISFVPGQSAVTITNGKVWYKIIGKA